LGIFYTDLDAALRTSEEFRRKADQEFHTGTSPLVKLAHFNFIDHVPPDYMHFWCLGVMRRFSLYTLHPKKKKKNVVWETEYEELNEHFRMLNEKNYCPSEFARKPRSLKFIKRFKATEFRQLLLYSGVILLKKLPMKYKKLFLLLLVSLRFLTNVDNLDDRENVLDYVQELLILFVRRSEEIFGEKFVTYNVHMLIHVVYFYRKFGSVDNFSCFLCESELGKYKKTVKSGYKPLQQFINRFAERLTAMALEVPKKCNFKPVLLKPMKNSNRREQRIKYRQLSYKGVHLRINRIGDQFCEMNEYPFMVKKIFHDLSNDQIYLSGDTSLLVYFMQS